MESFIQYILTALALMLVIEGLLYALFTDSVRRMMAVALTLPPEKLRFFGFFMAGIGLFTAWILQKL